MPSEKRQRKRENSQARAAALAAARRRQQQRRRLTVVLPAAVVVGGLLVLLIVQSSHKSKSSKLASTTSTTSPGASTTVAGGPPKATPVPAGAKITGPTPCPKPDGSSPRTSSFAQSPPTCIDPAKSYTATFDTTEGKIVIALDTKRTPNTVNNFVVLSRYHYYDKSSFDRIDTSIDIIQGGSPTTQSISDPGPGYNIKDEGGTFTTKSGQYTGPFTNYQPGDLVMARGGAADSASAQYFFVVGSKASALDSQGTYVTFGHVTAGLDVLQKVEGLYMACSPSDQSCLGGGPSRVVLVNSITITES